MTMDIFASKHYRFNKLLLSFVGQWPRQTTKQRYFFGTTTLLLILSLFVPKVIKLVEVLGDFEASVDIFAILGIHFTYMFKDINYIINSKKMLMLTDEIEKNWAVRTRDFEKIILENYAQRGKKIAIIYTAYVGSSVILYLSLPVIPFFLDFIKPLNESRERIFCFQVEYFVDQNEKYFYIWAHAWIAGPIGLLKIVASDMMFTANVHHACSMFAILGAHLENIGRRGVTNKLSVIRADCQEKRDEIYEDIVTCIKIHNDAVEFARLLESWGSVCSFFVVGLAMFTLSLGGYMAVTHLDKPGEAMKYIAFVVAEVAQLFYLSWQGHVLVNHSESVFETAYNVNWYDFPPDSQKLLVLIMVRSLEPCKLTAGKIFVFSMPTFAAAMKTSMSYFTVLLSMQ